MEEPELTHEERGRIWMEIGVVIALGVLPHTLGVMIGWARSGVARPSRDAPYYLYAMGMNAQVILPLLWIMARSGRPWPYFGVVRPRWRLDIALALSIPLLILFTHYAGGIALWLALESTAMGHNILGSVAPNESALTSMRAVPANAGEWLALAGYQMANGFGEELVLRGYLLVRIREVIRNPVLAVLLVSTLAAAYHLYQGSSAALNILVGQAVLSALYLRVPRVIPFAVGHGLYDLGLYIWRAGLV